PQTFTFYLGGNTNPEYITSTSTTVYLSWTDNDIESYCINTENNSSTCNWVSTTGNSITPSYTISTQGSQTRYAFIRDAAENISPVVSDEVFLDSVAPVITSASDSGAGTANVTVTETGSGVTHVCINTSSTSTSGCIWDEVSGTTFTSTTAVTATGNYYIHVKDKVGNIGHRTSSLYIQKPLTAVEKIINTAGSSLWDSTLEDDGYRYVGTNPANYVCFGTTSKTTCTGNTDLYMYRIIGIFEDEDGIEHIKLIKKEALNISYKWNGNSNVDWDASDLYSGINGDYFLSNTTYSYMQDSIWKDKIIEWNYIATNTLTNESSGLSYYTEIVKNVYLHELNRSTKTSKVGKWKEVNAKIGLMYASDYLLALGSSVLAYTNAWATEAIELKTGWMHITQNDSAILSTSKTEPPNTFEWTMSRYGLYSGNYLAWRVTSDGGVNNHYVTNTYSVRPVFYLTSNVKITGGTGTSTDPFIID
ncbi:MAG: hypothetical protein IJY87_05375, partial [Bacilli bacterium]|nr:hypothetical protein [Bacilli bacterium]